MGVLEQLVVRVLGERLTDVGLIFAVRLQQFGHRRLGVLVDILDQARKGDGQGRRGIRCHLEWPRPGSGSRLRRRRLGLKSRRSGWHWRVASRQLIVFCVLKAERGTRGKGTRVGRHETRSGISIYTNILYSRGSSTSLRREASAAGLWRGLICRESRSRCPASTPESQLAMFCLELTRDLPTRHGTGGMKRQASTGEP